MIGEKDNQTSWSAKKEAAEFFGTKGAAQKRAVTLANSEPGELFYICKVVQFADAEVESATYKMI